MTLQYIPLHVLYFRGHILYIVKLLCIFFLDVSTTSPNPNLLVLKVIKKEKRKGRSMDMIYLIVMIRGLKKNCYIFKAK